MATRVERARKAIIVIVESMLGALGNRALVALKTDRAIIQLRESGWILLERDELHQLIAYVETVTGLVETGDQRLLAQDGPAGNQPPDLDLVEWRKLYVAANKAHKQLLEINRQWVYDSISQSATYRASFPDRR